MSERLSKPYKVKSTEIVKGVARSDIYDKKGVLLVKAGSRVNDAHLRRIRDEGLITNAEDHHKDKKKLDFNYASPGSLHHRLDKLMLNFSLLQKNMVTEPAPEQKQELNAIIQALDELCEESIDQVLGELYLQDVSTYRFVKPLYVTASLIALIKRYNQFQGKQSIDKLVKMQLLPASLTYNLGLLKGQRNTYDGKNRLSSDQRNEIRRHYPQVSLEIIKQIGINDPITVDVIINHNVASKSPSFEALLMRTPFIYAGIAMPELSRVSNGLLTNPCQEFARMFADRKLDPVIGGLFLKINGLAPIGSILIFDTRELAVVIKGPDESNITSSTLRFITNKSGVQLSRPGDKFLLHKTELKQRGLNDHQQFSWNKFSPFTLWER